MAYTYGESPLHGYATPDDGTPLDATSWASLVDGIGIGTPVICASQTEQDDYLAAVNAAGYGPSSRSIIRVCRTDLDGLVMRNDGLGWARDWGGAWHRTGAVNATSSPETGGTRVNRGGITTDLPARALISFEGDVTVIPTQNGNPWHCVLFIEDDTGREITGSRRDYRSLPMASFSATTRAVVDMPAGTGRINFVTLVATGSQPITFSNVGVTAHYA